MAFIRRYGFTAHFKSEASNYVMRYRGGRMVRSGRGLSFWFMPRHASIIEMPLVDRQATLFLKGNSQDFQDAAVQGTALWNIVDPEKLADRIDFSLNLATGGYYTDPIAKIEARLITLAEQTAMQYFAELPIRALLDGGVGPLRERLGSTLIGTSTLDDIGIAVVDLSLGKLAPSSELERALQTPTFESLQQKADEAMFERRALAVDKERAIAENELANKTELARRESELIAKESENTRARATAKAEAGRIESAADADRIQTVEGARNEAERERAAIYRDMPSDVLMGLAAREFAKKLQKIEHLNVNPDLLSALAAKFGQSSSTPAPS